MITATIQPERLAWLESLSLDAGNHSGPADGACAMEAAAYLAGEKWSDRPDCVCPTITAFVRRWNDGLPSNADRDRLLKPVVPLLVGTRGGPVVERRRAWMAVDWLVREHEPAWLRLAGASHPNLPPHAAALAALPELIDDKSARVAQPTQGDARRAGAIVRDAVRAAAFQAARTTAWEAAWKAAGATAGAIGRATAWEGALHAAGPIAGFVTRDAVCVIARLAAGEDRLTPTVLALQESALRLLGRMIEVGS